MCSITYKILENSYVVVIIAQVAIASQLLIVRLRNVVRLWSAFKIHAFYFEQLLIVDNS